MLALVTCNGARELDADLPSLYLNFDDEASERAAAVFRSLAT